MEGKETITIKKRETFLVDCTPPVYAGLYRIGDEKGYMAFNLVTKPKWLHRKFCQLLLGWKWIDLKN